MKSCSTGGSFWVGLHKEFLSIDPLKVFIDPLKVFLDPLSLSELFGYYVCQFRFAWLHLFFVWFYSSMVNSSRQLLHLFFWGLGGFFTPLTFLDYTSHFFWSLPCASCLIPQWFNLSRQWLNLLVLFLNGLIPQGNCCTSSFLGLGG